MPEKAGWDRAWVKIISNWNSQMEKLLTDTLHCQINLWQFIWKVTSYILDVAKRKHNPKPRQSLRKWLKPFFVTYLFIKEISNQIWWSEDDLDHPKKH